MPIYPDWMTISAPVWWGNATRTQGQRKLFASGVLSKEVLIKEF